MDIVATLVFSILCGILYVLGLCLGLNYVETSVYICIYGCCYIVCAMSLVTLFLNIYKLFRKKSFKKALLVLPLNMVSVYVLIMISRGCLIYFSNYSTVDKQFDQCMLVLMNVAVNTGTTYENVNLTLYCTAFFSIICYNIFMQIILLKGNWRKNVYKEKP
jgi:amino acid transporter